MEAPSVFEYEVLVNSKSKSENSESGFRSVRNVFRRLFRYPGQFDKPQTMMVLCG